VLGARSVALCWIRPSRSVVLAPRANAPAVSETCLFISSSESAHHATDTDVSLHLLKLEGPSQLFGEAAVYK